jgi:hypothetical protein
MRFLWVFWGLGFFNGKGLINFIRHQFYQPATSNRQLASCNAFRPMNSIPAASPPAIPIEKEVFFG